MPCSATFCELVETNPLDRFGHPIGSQDLTIDNIVAVFPLVHKCNILQFGLVSYRTGQVKTVGYFNVQYSAVKCSVVQCSVIICSTDNAEQCSIVQCRVVQYSAVQCSTVQYRYFQYSPSVYSKVFCSAG